MRCKHAAHAHVSRLGDIRLECRTQAPHRTQLEGGRQEMRRGGGGITIVSCTAAGPLALRPFNSAGAWPPRAPPRPLPSAPPRTRVLPPAPRPRAPPRRPWSPLRVRPSPRPPRPRAANAGPVVCARGGEHAAGRARCTPPVPVGTVNAVTSAGKTSAASTLPVRIPCPAVSKSLQVART